MKAGAHQPAFLSLGAENQDLASSIAYGRVAALSGGGDIPGVREGSFSAYVSVSDGKKETLQRTRMGLT